MPCAMRSAPSQRERTGLGINTSRSPARRKPSSNSSHTLLTSLPVASSPRTGSTGSLAKATTSATTTSPVRIQALRSTRRVTSVRPALDILEHEPGQRVSRVAGQDQAVGADDEKAPAPTVHTRLRELGVVVGHDEENFHFAA